MSLTIEKHFFSEIEYVTKNGEGNIGNKMDNFNFIYSGCAIFPSLA